MGKIEKKPKERVLKYLCEFPNETFRGDGDILYCTCCDKAVSTTLFPVTQHIAFIVSQQKNDSMDSFRRELEKVKKPHITESVAQCSSSHKTQKLEENISNGEDDGYFQIFLLSGLSAEARLKYEGIIRHLGGGVTQCPTYDPATTHIIIEKPIRSEKLLCCIASGKWVLHTSYLDSCYESRQFLPEEEYEWGNQRSIMRLPKMKEGSTEAGLAAAGYKWRKRRQDLGSTSPFRDMKVSLFTAENKKPSFTRLLEAGGATIFKQSEIHKCNYIIWEEGKVEIPIPLKELAFRRVHVVAPVFLGEFLVKATPPSDHYPPSYIAVIKQMKQRKH